MRHIRIVCFGLCFLAIYTNTYIKVLAGDLDIFKANSVVISADWEGLPLQNKGEMTIPLNTSGTQTWKAGYDSSNAEFNEYLTTLSKATYTLQLYRGVVGSSTLIHQETIFPGSTTSSSTFNFTFTETGPYFLAYTATYPEDSYPIGSGPENCQGDFCILPQYLLNDFQNFVTDHESGDYDHPVPALLGLNEFVLAENKASNILFLPGMMGSRLYTKDSNGNEKLIWEPIRNNDISLLAINSDGSSKQVIYTRDIIDYLYSNTPRLAGLVNILSKDASLMYLPFEEFMDTLVGEGYIKEWKSYPYDWRLSTDEIVRSGVLVGNAASQSRVRIQETLALLASSSPTGRVTIIGHSNGGLLAKAVAMDLEKSGKINLIDKIILVGTAQAGTPATIGSLLHGDGQTRAFGLVTSGVSIREQALTMPGVYGLLPSSSYFSLTNSPLITFGSHELLQPYRIAYGDSIKTPSSLESFLTDTAQLRLDYAVTDLRAPSILKSSILEQSNTLHRSVDTWTPPSSVSLVSITGVGQPTVSAYSYGIRAEFTGCKLLNRISVLCKKQPALSHEPIMTTQGDGTVTAISSTLDTNNQFFFNLQSYQEETGENIEHQNLLSSYPVQQQIRNIIHDSATVTNFISTSTPFLRKLTGSIVISVHSPMNILVTDSMGNQTGVVAIPDTDFSISKEEIPESSIQVVGDEKYIYLQESDLLQVSLDGYDLGNTSIEIGTVRADGTIHTHQTFEDIPTTASTTGTFSFSQKIAGSISIDTDGDETLDLVITPTPLEQSSSSKNINAKHGGQSKLDVKTQNQLTYSELLRTLIELKLQLLRLLQELGAKVNRSTMSKFSANLLINGYDYEDYDLLPDGRYMRSRNDS